MTVFRLLLVAIACAFGLAGNSRADTPDETLCHKVGDRDIAIDKIITACTRAIRQVAADDRDLIYLRRSKAYSLKGDFTRALADVEQSIKLYDVSKHIGVEGRGDIRFRMGELDAAASDYALAFRMTSANGTAALKRNMVWAVQGKFDRVIAGASEYLSDPNWAYAGIIILQRALAHYYAGAPRQALNDLKLLIDRDPKYYTAIEALMWHQVIAQRHGLPDLPDETRQSVLRVAREQLPLGLLTGKLTADAIAEEAKNDAKNGYVVMKWHSCNAHYYGALWASIKGKREEATAWFQRVIEDCDKDVDGDQRNWKVWAPPLEIKALAEAPPPKPVEGSETVSLPRPAEQAAASAPKPADTPPAQTASPAAPQAPAAQELGPPKSDATPSSEDGARVAYEFSERIGNQAAWEAFLTRYPQGFYADLARAQLAKLGVSVPAPARTATGAPASTSATADARDRSLAPLETFRDCPQCPEMVVAPSGNFLMGSPDNEQGRSADESPQHMVRFAQPFAAAKYAATFEDWDACVADGGCNGYRPGTPWGRGKMPVMSISWHDAKAYVDWLSRKTGKPYRLLSEAEREYITRAGTRSTYWWGDSAAGQEAAYKAPRPVLVTAFPPNPWGFFQVQGGSLYEWVEDCANPHYSGAPEDGSAWTEGLCTYRSMRGNSWDPHPTDVRSARRRQEKPDDRHVAHGFRVARSLQRAVEK